MGIISEVKCGRCGRRYSGFRGRCPYCGARRNKSGKHAEGTDATKGRLLIGVLLIAVLAAALIALIITNGTMNKKDTGKKDTEITETDKTSKKDKKDKKDKKSDKGDADKDGEVNTDEEPSDTTKPEDAVTPAVTPEPKNDTPKTTEPAEPTPDQKVEVESVDITYAGYVMEELDFTMQVGESLKLSYITDPEHVEVAPKWESSNIDVFVVLQDGTVSAVGTGTETLKLTVGTASVECVVRVE